MARLHPFLTLGLVCALAGVQACGDDAATSDGQSNLNGRDGSSSATLDAALDAALDAGASSQGDSGADAAAADDLDEDEDVPCTPDFPDYSDGMTAKAGDLTVRLLHVSPEPPRQQTPNTWVIEIVQADQTPALDATVSNADSYMPVHRHHGITRPVVQAGAAPGQTKISAINFKMRGPWQVNFDVTPAGGKPIITTFQVCVQ
ncbi:MAG: hypothetical protein JWN48_147 [Myxococcaceae bacterium]|nr:hypothetical protein [Myxococcaceae bacterium]